MVALQHSHITGYGLACSLGLNAGEACGAAHAGLSRAAALDMQMLDEDLLEEVPLVGHALPVLTHGFGVVGRYYQMAKAALDDLVNNTRIKFSNKTALCLLVNDDVFGRRALQKQLESIEDSIEREREQKKYEAGVAEFRQAIRGTLITQLIKDTALPIPKEQQFALFGSPAQFSRVISEAIALLDKGQYDHIIVGAVDSLVNAESLESLVALGILKTPDNPVGFMPGEAASFITLSRSDCLAGERPLARLSRVSGITRDKAAWEDEPATGKAMCEAIESLSLNPNDRMPCCCVALNGSEYRAVDFGTTLTRLGSKGLPREFNLKMPVESFGEVGVAAGPMFTCFALHGMLRNPAKTADFAGGALVSLYAEDGERSAFTLSLV